LFIYFIDETKSIRFITELQNDLQKSMEPECEVHQPWEELFDGSPCWKPYVKSSYDGYDSGGKVGPSNAITQTLRTQKTLCSAFFFIFLVPCDCNKCFFCKIGKINGIYHKFLVTESKKTGNMLRQEKEKKEYPMY